MNIFYALSKGKGCINEENTSSFLGYLLDPYEDHGLKDEFVKRFLKRMKTGKINIINDNEINNTDLKDYDVQLEVPVKVNDKKNRVIDIVFKTKKHIIAIENKIKKESCQNNQLDEEYWGLEKEKLEDKQIILCFLAPDMGNKEIAKYQKSIPSENFYYFNWNDVSEILEEILVDENTAKIDPIGSYIKQTIKAFINFIRYFCNDSIIVQKSFILNEENYTIYKYKSTTIKVERITNNKAETVSAKEVIRRKLDEYKDIDKKYSYEKTGEDERNTRTVGAWLINLI